MATKGKYTKHSKIDEYSDAEIDLMIQSLGPMDPVTIGEIFSITNTRVHQICQQATEKALRTLERRGIRVDNLQDILPTGDMDRSYWRER